MAAPSRLTLIAGSISASVLVVMGAMCRQGRLFSSRVTPNHLTLLTRRVKSRKYSVIWRLRASLSRICVIVAVMATKNLNKGFCMRAFLFTFLLCIVVTPAFAGSAYDRVMKTQSINCGYGEWKPWVYKNLETGKMEGVIVGLVEELARTLTLKTEWPEETGWANLPEALRSGKIDVACSTMWRDPIRGKQVAFTKPLFYMGMHAYMRKGDKRFTGKIEELNDPAVRVVAQDGDYTYDFAKRVLPKAILVTLPMTASEADKMLNVTTGKADVMFYENVGVEDFNKNNKDQLERILFKEPLAVFANSLAVNITDSALKEMLDTAIEYMKDTGKTEALTAQFMEDHPNSIILPKKDW
ncbi:MAG: transporter substrate-binding domain-containing protein [Alphaproteobacteria bacterium]|nr:transporter substrate-binding domain-containing protein [Alphaproteobacteria bacterium]